MCYVSRFDPEGKVLINLSDGGRFVDIFLTCSYMAGYSECKVQFLDKIKQMAGCVDKAGACQKF